MILPFSWSVHLSVGELFPQGCIINHFLYLCLDAIPFYHIRLRPPFSPPATRALSFIFFKLSLNVSSLQSSPISSTYSLFRFFVMDRISIYEGTQETPTYKVPMVGCQTAILPLSVKCDKQVKKCYYFVERSAIFRNASLMCFPVTTPNPLPTLAFKQIWRSAIWCKPLHQIICRFVSKISCWSKEW